MNHTRSLGLLRRLGAGESIAAICHSCDWTRAEFDAWWRSETASRLSPPSGTVTTDVQRTVTIHRDRWGIPHLFAQSPSDLAFGFGYAMAQDRLFQLDYLRRKGAGRLAEILGPSSIADDRLVRTVGLRRIAADELATLPDETRAVLEAFSAGVNAVIEACRDRPPIEFDLLDYRPEPWTPLDSLTVELEFRWYLTGRFPVIVMPEWAKRTLGDGPLYDAFLTREANEESVVPPGHYARSQAGREPIGPAWGRPHGTSTSPVITSPTTSALPGEPPAAIGSNNWVISGRRTATGLPLVGSDPHIAFEAVSCWYEVHLHSGSLNVTGMAYVGMPAVMFGRNERVAWGCTNNICSQRDLYLERTSPEHPGGFEFDGRWEPEQRVDETIVVRGQEPVRFTVRFSRNGPLVEDVLPSPARGVGSVSLRWLGAHGGGWLTALLAMNQARSADELRAAMRPWIVPTFALVFADVDGHIGYQMTGRVPVRNVPERGYRPGWDPRHQWDGLIPFNAAPQLADPDQGWIATANFRPAPDDFPYPQSFTAPDGLRAARIRQMMNAQPRCTRETCGAMQLDALSLRAVAVTPALVVHLREEAVIDPRFKPAADILAAWDGRYEPDRVGASLFDAFFPRWCDAVARARFDAETAALLVNGVNSLAARLIRGDDVGWFAPGGREASLTVTFRQALDYLADRLGPEMPSWTWGRLHTLPLRHVLGTRGDLSELMNHGGAAVPGNSTTVCNTWPNPDLTVRTGANYRLVADLAESPPGLWAVDSQSQSGQVSSPHYADQLPDWVAGRYHFLPLDRTLVESGSVARLELLPRDESPHSKVRLVKD